MTLAKPIATDAVVLMQTDWQGYSKILEVVGDQPIRVTYDRGTLAIMSPGRKHERLKAAVSAVLPWLTPATILEFVALSNTATKPELLRRVTEWVQHHRG